MPLATKNGSLIVKSGSIAENCNCCAGGWYCFNQCDSCPAGIIPAAVRVQIAFTMGDGSTTFQMRLVRAQTNQQIIDFGACPLYGGTNGAPGGLGYDSTLSPNITFTVNRQFGGPISKTFQIGIVTNILFLDSCNGNDAILSSGFSSSFDDMQWYFTGTGTVSPFVSSGTGFCYLDYSSPTIPIRYYSLSENKNKDGTFQMTVISAE